ncbi:MAG: hypothetical protein WKG01_03840 [Kofleriaceae bacterium]
MARGLVVAVDSLRTGAVAGAAVPEAHAGNEVVGACEVGEVFDAGSSVAGDPELPGAAGSEAARPWDDVRIAT